MFLIKLFRFLHVGSFLSNPSNGVIQTSGVLLFGFFLFPLDVLAVVLLDFKSEAFIIFSLASTAIKVLPLFIKPIWVRKRFKVFFDIPIKKKYTDKWVRVFLFYLCLMFLICTPFWLMAIAHFVCGTTIV